MITIFFLNFVWVIKLLTEIVVQPFSLLFFIWYIYMAFLRNGGVVDYQSPSVKQVLFKVMCGKNRFHHILVSQRAQPWDIFVSQKRPLLHLICWYQLSSDYNPFLCLVTMTTCLLQCIFWKLTSDLNPF